MRKRLFCARVEVEVFYMDYTHDEENARKFLLDDIRVNGLEDVSHLDVLEVTARDFPLGYWYRGALVYGADVDTRLGEALDAIPVKP